MSLVRFLPVKTELVDSQILCRSQIEGFCFRVHRDISGSSEFH